MKFIVDRSKWRSGGTKKYSTGIGHIALENEKGYMCCLGFCAKQLNINDIMNIGEPCEIEINFKNENALISINKHIGSICNSQLSNKAIDINDNCEITQREREKQLRELFKSEGHQIVFKGKSYKYGKKNKD